MYEEYYLSAKTNIIDLLDYYTQDRKYKIAVWGAGLKGVSFLQTIDPNCKYISYIYDIDEKKAGSILITGHMVADYRLPQNKDVQVVLLMNNNYENEVLGLLAKEKLDVILVNMESMIDGALTVDEVLKMKHKCRITELRDIRPFVAAMVILYNCGLECMENIKSYCGQFELIFVYDNSTMKNEMLIQKLKSISNVEYIDGQGNQGLAVSINEVAEKAISRNFLWLITFDQDSLAEKDLMEKMSDYINYCEILDRVGIVCPAVKDPVFEFELAKSEITYNKWVQQSGSMLNLMAFREIGGYDKALFIDQVDFEYCVRLRQRNYKIVKVNKAILLHNTMDMDTIFLRKKGRPLYINKFSPMRYYYNTRNILYCTKKYKKTDVQYREAQRRNLGSLLRTLPYERKKMKRMRAIILGYIDYRLGKMGKTNRNL